MHSSTHVAALLALSTCAWAGSVRPPVGDAAVGDVARDAPATPGQPLVRG